MIDGDKLVSQGQHDVSHTVAALVYDVERKSSPCYSK
jgi:hypothetical protein